MLHKVTSEKEDTGMKNNYLTINGAEEKLAGAT